MVTRRPTRISRSGRIISCRSSTWSIRFTTRAGPSSPGIRRPLALCSALSETVGSIGATPSCSTTDRPTAGSSPSWEIPRSTAPLMLSASPFPRPTIPLAPTTFTTTISPISMITLRSAFGPLPRTAPTQPLTIYSRVAGPFMARSFVRMTARRC